MKLRSIEAFCMAVEEKSISAAARHMYLSQPSVSERLAELEREVQVPLLIRSRSGVQLTAEGVTFYEQASKVLKEVGALRATVQSLQDKANMRLRFAACVTVGERLLPEWLWQFKKQMPEVVPTVLMGNDQEVASAVKSGEMSIGIVASDEGLDDLESTTILADELLVVVAPNHAWAQRSISPEDLSKEPFIAREQGATIRAVTEQALKDMGDISLNVQMELGSITAIKEAIESGSGFSILSRADVQRKLEVGKLVEVKGLSIPWSFKLVRHPSTPLSMAEQRFNEFVLGMCKQVRKLGSLERRAEVSRAAP